MTENDAFKGSLKVLDLFEEGRKFTLDLLKENERLRLVIAGLRNEDHDAGVPAAAPDAGELKERIKLLEEENAQLKTKIGKLERKFTEAEAENREFAERYSQVERQNSDLVSLYVAGYSLHSTVKRDDVLQTIKEIVINMIGSEHFGLFDYDEETKKLVLIEQMGMEGDPGVVVAHVDHPAGKALASGETYIAPKQDVSLKRNPPAACVPFKVNEKVTGMLIIEELLVQKPGFLSVDFELFKVLSTQGAAALQLSNKMGN